MIPQSLLEYLCVLHHKSPARFALFLFKRSLTPPFFPFAFFFIATTARFV